MAVISLDLSSTLRWASTRLLALAQAETMCTIALPPVLRVPHSDLPSMATTSPAVSRAIEPTHAANPFSNSFGAKAAKTRLKVSWEGNPARQAKRTPQLLALRLAVVLDLVPTVRPTQNRRDRY